MAIMNLDFRSAMDALNVQGSCYDQLFVEKESNEKEYAVWLDTGGRME